MGISFWYCLKLYKMNACVIFCCVRIFTYLRCCRISHSIIIPLLWARKFADTTNKNRRNKSSCTKLLCTSHPFTEHLIRKRSIIVSDSALSKDHKPQKSESICSRHRHLASIHSKESHTIAMESSSTSRS